MSGVPIAVSYQFLVGPNLLRTQQVCLYVGFDLAGQDAGFLPLAGNPRPPGLYVGHNPAQVRLLRSALPFALRLG